MHPMIIMELMYINVPANAKIEEVGCHGIQNIKAINRRSLKHEK